MTKWPWLFSAVVATACLSSTAGAVSAASDKGGSPPPAAPPPGERSATYHPPPSIRDRIGGLKVSMTQINYPGVPERSACRFLVRVTNGSTVRLGAHTLVRTYDSFQAPLNTWLVPTGDLAPGQSVERIYSCKMAQSMVLDQSSAGAWPGRCTVDGEERSPCPASLQVESNMNLLSAEPVPASAASGAKH